MPQRSATLTITVLLLAISADQLTCQTITQCNYDASICGCKTEQGDIRLKDKTYTVTDQVSSFTYNWNPCKDISIGTTTAACIQQYETASYDCGSHASTSSSVQGGQAMFSLIAVDGQRQSTIICKCADTSSFAFEQEMPQGVYDFTLSDKSCCPGSSGSGGGSSDGLSPGSILLIIALVLVVVYLVGGVAVQAGLRKAEGKEKLPNVQFWSALPGLIRDGFRFTFTCGRSSTYDAI